MEIVVNKHPPLMRPVYMNYEPKSQQKAKMVKVSRSVSNSQSSMHSLIK